MPFIETVQEHDKPNFVNALSLRPDAFAAWQGLIGAIRDNKDQRRYELVTIAAAKRLKSSYCMLAHGAVLTKNFYSGDELREIATDHHAADLDDLDVAVMDLAVKIVDDASAVTQDDIDGLRSLGLSDAEITDVVLAACARCFLSKAVDALGAQPDAAYNEVDAALREALVVGRPISD